MLNFLQATFIAGVVIGYAIFFVTVVLIPAKSK